MFKVNEFKWLTTNDQCMREYDNWSRPYEYAYVINKIRSLTKSNSTIHNTCCGTQNIHLQFAQALNETSNNVTHSDMIISDMFSQSLNNVILYNLYENIDKTFDVVVCVSSLEDAYDVSPIYADKAFDNLMNQINFGGRLIITCDYPTVSLEWCEDKLGQKITESSPRLHSANSIYPRTDFSHYNIIAMDITKL